MAYAPLERAVMAALAYELRDEVPDLARQFSHSRPGQRRNSGLGLYTEMIADRGRPRPARSGGAPLGPSGNLGTVHAMVGDLRDPIAFQARLSNGRLLALFGDSYGQDTRGIDFATTPFDQVFMLDAQGRSVAFEPAAPSADAASAWRQPPPAVSSPKPEPRPAARAEQPRGASGPTQTTKPAVRTAPKAASPDPFASARTAGQSLDAFLNTGEPAVVRDVVTAAFNTSETPAPLNKEDKTSLIIGLWVAIGAGVIIAILIFEVSPIFAVVLGAFAGRALQSPKGLAFLQRGRKAWQDSRAAQSAKP